METQSSQKSTKCGDTKNTPTGILHKFDDTIMTTPPNDIMFIWTVCRPLTQLLIIFCTISGCSGKFRKSKQSKEPRTEAMNSVYNGCGFIKTCLKICLERDIPNNPCNTCIKTRSCPALVNIRYDRKAREFTSQLYLHRIPEGNIHGYVAIGLSGKTGPPGMRNSIIVACIYRRNLDGTVNGTAFGAWSNNDFTLTYLPFNQPDKHPFYNRKSEYQKLKRDATFMCEFTWKTNFSIETVAKGVLDFNLETDLLAIIGARGYVGDDSQSWALKGHVPTSNGRVYEKEKRKLQLVPIHENDDYDEDYDSSSAFPLNYNLNVQVYLLLLSIIFGRYQLSTSSGP